MSNEIGKIKIEDLGYDEFFESGRQKLGFGDFPVARVAAEHKGSYRVVGPDGEFLARITGKQMFSASSREDYPAVGDWVAITELDGEQAVIRGMLPRKTVIKRIHGDRNKAGEKTDVQVIGANIDVAFVVESIGRDYNLNRFERYFAIIRNGGVEPAIILNKTDLASSQELDFKLAEIRERFGDISIVSTSVLSGQGLEELRALMLRGKTYCFLGSSGVGKSSLVNGLIGESLLKTGNISSYSERGRHITTGREMHILEGGYIVIDNPGMREVGVADASMDIDGLFEEIASLAVECKYADCSHTNESGCGVLAALTSGGLDEARYANYMRLKREAEYYEMSDLEKREKDRDFGKFLKAAKKELKKRAKGI